MSYPYRTPNGYEERLNRQVTGHFQYSLAEGAELLNRAFRDVPVVFGDDATVVAHQDNPLSHTADTDIDREIDWVIRDSDLLAGFESKYGAKLKTPQLRDELAKLRANAGERDVALIAVTHHAQKPSLLSEFEDEPVYWTSWLSVATAMRQATADEVSPAQRVPLQMLQDLFEVEDMNPFSGFDHHTKMQYRYFARDLRPVLDELGLENRGTLHNWVQESVSPSGYARIVPKYVAVPFVRQERPPHNEAGRPKSKRASTFLAAVDTERHVVHAGVVFGISNVDGHRQMILEHSDAIAQAVHATEFELWIGRNSINNRDVPPEKTRDLDEMREWLSTTGKMVLAPSDEDNTYRKVWFVRECAAQEPTDLFRSVSEAIGEQHELFIESNEFLDQSTLVAPETETVETAE